MKEIKSPISHEPLNRFGPTLSVFHETQLVLVKFKQIDPWMNLFCLIYENDYSRQLPTAITREKKKKMKVTIFLELFNVYGTILIECF